MTLLSQDRIDRIRDEMESRNITIKSLAESIGVNHVHLGGILLGKRGITTEIAKKIADKLELSSSWIMGLSEDATLEEFIYDMCMNTDISEKQILSIGIMCLARAKGYVFEDSPRSFSVNDDLKLDKTEDVVTQILCDHDITSPIGGLISWGELLDIAKEASDYIVFRLWEHGEALRRERSKSHNVKKKLKSKKVPIQIDEDELSELPPSIAKFFREELLKNPDEE